MEIWKTLAAAGLNSVISAAVTLLIGIIAVRIVTDLVQKALDRSKLEKAAHSLILSLLKVTLYVLLALIVASSLGIDVTGVVALASVLTLSLSLALQTMLSNVIGGFTVLTNHPFRSGDYVDIGGQAGTVSEISMTYTKLVTPDNKVISIPNSTVSAAQVINYSSAGTRRVDIAVSASYDMPTEQVIEALLKAGRVKGALQDPAPFAGVTEYGESCVAYTLRVWCSAADYWDVFFAINNGLKGVFADSNVAMSYPHLNVHLDK